MSEQEENVESEKLAEDIRQIKEMGYVTLPARYTLPEHYRSGGGALYFACTKQDHQV